MPLRIEDYGLIGDMQTAALVGRDGSIDWLCLPRFDSGACFAALLGDERHGRWLIAPVDGGLAERRRYRPDSLVLETEFEANGGTVRVVDCMPPREVVPDLVRVVEGVGGEVQMRCDLGVRFDYGSIVPWIRQVDGTARFIGGPDALSLWCSVPLTIENGRVVAVFTVRAGERIPFVLAWHPSHVPPPDPVNGLEEVDTTEQRWREWCAQSTYDGPWREAVMRSLITLKALTYAPTGGVVAAATTSLPEQIGGVRNWDYRYCWLRDATFTLYALMGGGYVGEAQAWRNWLLRSVAGDPAELRVLYGPAGERRLPELELPWLPGYERSQPVRIGNAATDQRQLDVYGEVLDTMYLGRRLGMPEEPAAWALEREMIDCLEQRWREPDEGIWEVRGPRRHFTHSKVMAWVAVDRAVKAVERFGREGPLARWRALRCQIHEDVCTKGYDAARGCFTQSYGSPELDASLLMIPLVGFLPPDDPRVAGTVAAVERELVEDGLILRYRTHHEGDVDGLPAGEGVFIACSFWLADNYVLLGRIDEATLLFERLLALQNDVGLLAEEYDPRARRLVGNFPQAFSHVGLLNTARNLTTAAGPASHRPERTGGRLD